MAALLDESNKTQLKYLAGVAENDICTNAIVKCCAVDFLPSCVRCQGVVTETIVLWYSQLIRSLLVQKVYHVPHKPTAVVTDTRVD